MGRKLAGKDTQPQHGIISNACFIYDQRTKWKEEENWDQEMGRAPIVRLKFPGHN